MIRRPVTRIILAFVFFGSLAAAFAASSNSFNDRWTTARDDVVAAQRDIPQQKLHDRALEILRNMEAK